MVSHEENTSIVEWFLGPHPYMYPPYGIEIIHEEDQSHHHHQTGEYYREYEDHHSTSDVDNDEIIARTLQDDFLQLEIAENNEYGWNDQSTVDYSSVTLIGIDSVVFPISSDMTASESNAPSVDPNIVGNAFVQKYYTHLYENTAGVYRFYLEESVLGRPGLEGEMVSIKSLKAINDQIMSFDYQNSKIQILSADSQGSLKDAVVTLVAGLVIGKDGERKSFTQSFFLVPQNGSYFVLNDVFRYVSDVFVEPEATKEVEESPKVIESKETIAEPATEIVEAVVVPSQAKTTVTKHAKVHKEKVTNGNSNLPKAAEAKAQEDAPKKSFAVIAAQNGAQFNAKASPEKPRVAPQAKSPAPVPERPSAQTIEQRAQGSSIFVANLPMDATPEQLFETFKGFGAIRKGGIQVRSYMEKRNCFGFVVFENRESIKSVFQAHKESPIIIGNRRASIEEKRANNNGNGGRDSARTNGNNRNENGYRKEGYRPRGNDVNGGRVSRRNGPERRNGDATGDAKASQINGHGNAQASY